MNFYFATFTSEKEGECRERNSHKVANINKNSHN